MGRAVLEIDGDMSGLRAAFLEAREDSRRTSEAIIEDSRRAGVVMRAMWRSVQKQATEALAAVRKEEERTTARSEELAERRRRVVETEAGYRTSAFRTAADETIAAEDNATRAHVQGAARRKRATEDTARAAVRAAEQVHRAWTRAGERTGGQVFEAATQAGGQVLGEARSERERLATTERSVGSALYQAGGRRSDVVEATRALQRFAADNNMDETELASALNAAQTEFSVLGDRNTSRADRGRNLNRFLETSLLARNTGNSPGEMARLSGLFGQSGLDAGTQRELMLEAAGLAQRGSIETGSITREAMPAITARIGQAMSHLGANATPEQRQRAARDAFVQSMAEIEVARGTQGTSAREAGNVLRNTNVDLRSNVKQEKMLQNIRTRMGRNSELERALFEADPTRRGHMRLRDRFTDAMSFTEEFGRVAGNNSELFQNIFAGGGHGNPQGLIANQRRILGNLLNSDAQGKTGVGRVRELMQGSALTQADVNRGAEIFGGDTAAELAGNRARRGLGLTEPGVTGTVSALDRFAAEHPLLAPLASAGMSLAGEKAFQAIGGRLGGLFGAKGGGGAPGGLLGRVAGPVGAFFSTLLTPSNAGERAHDDRAMIRAHTEAGGGRMGTEAALHAMQDAVERGVQRGMQQARVTATVTPQAAAHAASEAAGSRGGR